MSIPIDRRSSSRDIAPSSAAVWTLIANAHLKVARWFARSRQRRALREIAERNDLHLLKDIGVSQEEALREADKAFWRL
jgi:uncharacterized protein YjiS (DUF1127 family)